MESKGNFVEAVRSGDRLALARLITKIENRSPDGLQALDALFPFTGHAHLVGVTGSPGSGKSTLVNHLVRALRDGGKTTPPPTVAVIAVDPTSPFSGGALLGDRVRMGDLAGDTGVFIRSMASRGALGGLAHATSAVTRVVDAAGFDIIIIETVGAGQTEVEIARLAHTIIVVEAPGMGDDIQAIKAGILEIADILVVNKSDRPGAENAVNALRSMLELARSAWAGDEITNEADCSSQNHSWRPPILQTIATQSTGMEALLDAIQDHWDYLIASGERLHREQERLQSELNHLLQAALVANLHANVPDDAYQEYIYRLTQREISPQRAVQELLGMRARTHADSSSA
jgi:LAO/AO transport system kinase